MQRSVMRTYANVVNLSSVAAGWRVLRRHLRYASADPRKLLWIASRAWQILRRGELHGVLERHRLIEDFYRDYRGWIEVDERKAVERTARYVQEAAGWRERPR